MTVVRATDHLLTLILHAGFCQILCVWACGRKKKMRIVIEQIREAMSSSNTKCHFGSPCAFIPKTDLRAPQPDPAPRLNRIGLVVFDMSHLERSPRLKHRLPRFFRHAFQPRNHLFDHVALG